MSARSGLAIVPKLSGVGMAMVQCMSRRSNCHAYWMQLSNEDFFPRHQRLWRGLRNLLTGSSVPVRAAALAAELQPLLQDGWRQSTAVRRHQHFADHHPQSVMSPNFQLSSLKRVRTVRVKLPAHSNGSGGDAEAGRR